MKLNLSCELFLYIKSLSFLSVKFTFLSIVFFEKERGIKVEGNTSKDTILERLKAQATSQPQEDKIYLDDEKQLHWPVYFLYPEYNQSDFIEDFCECNRYNCRFLSRISLVTLLMKTSTKHQA